MRLDEYDCLTLDDLPLDCVHDCSASGDVTDAVTYWVERLDFEVARVAAIAYLQEFGAWTDQELAETPDRDHAMRVLWIACGQLADDIHDERTPHWTFGH